MRATLSILGLYNYDASVLDGLTVPEGLERDTLIDYICMECAELELLYPDPQIMRQLITSWASARQHSWERLYQSTVQRYNMIHNYDRYEEWQDDNTRSDTGSGSANATGNSTQTINKPGYNVNTGMVSTERETVTNATNSTANNRTDSKNTGKHSGHLYGNIGVTTAAQMLTEERELYKWDVYAAITNEFKTRFCVMVY